MKSTSTAIRITFKTKSFSFLQLKLTATSHYGQNGLGAATAREREREQRSAVTSVRQWVRWRNAKKTIAQVMKVEYMPNMNPSWLQDERMVKLVRVSHAEHWFSLSRLQSARCKQVIASFNPSSSSLFHCKPNRFSFYFHLVTVFFVIYENITFLILLKSI